MLLSALSQVPPAQLLPAEVPGRTGFLLGILGRFLRARIGEIVPGIGSYTLGKVALDTVEQRTVLADLVEIPVFSNAE